MDITSTRDNPSPTATTAELAQFIQSSPETILRYKRLEDEGPFREHRDYIYLGLGRRKLLWDLRVAQQSLWSYKRGETSSEVETFGRSSAPVSV